MIYFAFVNHKVKVLIIRFSSIGDIVLTTPVIRGLKTQLEGEVEIHYLTKKMYAGLLENNSYVSKIHTIEKSTNEVIEDLKAENFDYIVDLHKNLRSARVKKSLKGFSFAFNKLNTQKWLLVNLKVNRMPDVHIVDRYLEAVKALGIKNDGEGLDYFLSENTKFKLPSSFNSNYVVLVLGANHATKRIPFEKLKEITAAKNKNFVLVGGKEDSKMGEQIEALAPERIFNACGKTNLNESALLIKNSSVVITPDTGMMHVAAAFRKRIISVWGNTVPEFGMYPYLPKESQQQSYIIETKNLKCRPCSKIGYNKCPKGHFKCMLEIDPDKILALLD